MALPTYYNTGTATIAAADTAVVGTGTAWLTNGVQAGDLFWAAGIPVRIAAVVDNTHLTLAYAWPGSTRTAQSYEVQFAPDLTRSTATNIALLEALSKSPISAIGTLTPAANKFVTYTGASTAVMSDITAAGLAILDDPSVSAQRTTLGLGTAAIVNTGTSGANIPLLNGTNVFSGGTSFSGTVAVTGSTNTFSNVGSTTFGGQASATRFLSINNFGLQTLRYDDNGATAVPLAVQNFGLTGSNQGGGLTFTYGTGAASGMNAFTMFVLSTDTWAAAGNRSARLSLSLANAGSIGERFGIDADGTIKQNGTTVLDVNRLYNARSYTVATLPTAGTAGRVAYASDARMVISGGTLEGAGVGTGGLVSDRGTAWRVAGTNITAVA